MVWQHGQSWIDSGWYYKPDTPSQLVEAVARLGVYGTNHRFAWRGSANCNYELTSSLHRRLVNDGLPVTEERLREREDHTLERARDWGLGIEGGHMVDDFQLLADLQHYDVPTRLIDVTSNPMTALWFACQANQRDSARQRGASEARWSATGLLLGLNLSPWYDRRNDDGARIKNVFKTVGRPPVTWGQLGDGLGYQRTASLQLETPFIVSSSMPNARLRAQEGYFVASRHPDRDNAPLVSLDTPIPQGDPANVRSLLTDPRGRGLPANVPFVAIFVESGLKTLLKNLKFTFNRTARVLFPDFTGFHRYGDRGVN